MTTRDQVHKWFFYALGLVPIWVLDAFVLSRYTALPLPIVYLFVNGVDLLKCIIGFILVKKGVWVNNIVASSQDVPQAD